MGLTQRMLVQLKSLADPIKYWEDGEMQTEEGAYMLLGFEEADMYALGHKVKRAQKLIDEKHYHAAYDKLCEVRPWFLADSPAALQALREHEAERRLKAEEKKDRKKNDTK